jgi:hypothetical protein
MKRAIGNATKAQQAYQDALRSLGCAVCAWRVAQGLQRMQAGVTHIHHRNLDDKHGQRQLGHDAVVALCAWHHDGDQLTGKSRDQMRALFGPSFKHHARDFRVWTADVLPGYGRGTEAWQRWQDEQLHKRGGVAA